MKLLTWRLDCHRALQSSLRPCCKARAANGVRLLSALSDRRTPAVQEIRRKPGADSKRSKLSGHIDRSSSVDVSHGEPADGHVRHAQLPLPPFMDPAVMATRNKHRQKTPLPDDSDLADFREKIESNPYVLALATPIRHCHLTKARLPGFYHNTLYQKPHPETGKTWMLPIDLNAGRLWGGGRMARINIYGQVARLLNSEWMISKVLNQKIVGRIMTESLREETETIMKPKKLVVREDLPVLIRTLMQTSAATALRRIFERRNRPETWLEVVDGPHTPAQDGTVACVLYLGPCSERLAQWTNLWVQSFEQLSLIMAKVNGILNAAWRRSQRKSDMILVPSLEAYGISNLQPSFQCPPLSFPTVTNGGKEIPLYHLEQLLGSERLSELRKDTRYADAKWLLVKERRRARDAQMHLMKLQGYVTRWP